MCVDHRVLRLTFGAVLADPPRVALAGAIDGVTGAVVGAQTRLSTAFTIFTAGTDCGHTQI